MLNLVQLIGNLGQDPDMRATQSGTQVATLNIATSERWKDKDGNQQESTEWHRVVVWNRLAGICGEYLAKGSKVYISGKLQTRKWQDNDGNDRWTTEIVAREMKMLDAKGQQSSGGNEPPVPQEPENGDYGDVPF